MGNTLVITKKNYESGSSAIISALYDDKKAVEIIFSDYENKSMLNNIYVGKVKNIVKNIGAAFIEISNGIICYYKIDENKNPIYTKHQSDNKLCIGDELLVQVIKEAQKTKQPVVTSILSFISKNIILTSGNTRMGISSKLSDDVRNKLKKLANPYKNNEFGLIFRTNSQNASAEILEQQIKKLTDEFHQVIVNAKFRTCFSLVYEGQQNYISEICGMYDGVLSKIITDEKIIYDKILEYSESERPEYLEIINFYNDNMITLANLYNLNREIDVALNQRVWLKSGAYLIIQPTEALTVIDVNTGKFTGNKKQRETYLKINLEAAKEIARQIRLRNISGICIVDFIDMEYEDDKEKLMKEFGDILEKDPIKTSLVDITKLNLVELTRKRIKKPLYEQVMSYVN